MTASPAHQNRWTNPVVIPAVISAFEKRLEFVKRPCEAAIFGGGGGRSLFCKQKKKRKKERKTLSFHHPPNPPWPTGEGRESPEPPPSRRRFAMTAMIFHLPHLSSHLPLPSPDPPPSPPRPSEPPPPTATPPSPPPTATPLSPPPILANPRFFSLIFEVLIYWYDHLNGMLWNSNLGNDWLWILWFRGSCRNLEQCLKDSRFWSS